jgi:hypothetical protein
MTAKNITPIKSNMSSNSVRPKIAKAMTDALVLFSASIWDVSLDTANKWFNVSWYGILIAGAATAVTAVATVIFLIVQFWSSSIRDTYAELRTSDIEERGKLATLKIKESELAISEAVRKAAEANRRGEEAKRDAAAAHERAAFLERDSAQARMEQEKLRQQLAWRRITKEQHDIIVNVVRSHQLADPLDVSVPLGDAEAATFAADIIRTLRDGALPVKDASAGVWMPIPPSGIVLNQPGAERIAHPIAQALTAAGLVVIRFPVD